MRGARFFFPSAAVFLACLSNLSGQEVVSARSGVVHFIEGSVFLDDHPVDRKSGAFPVIPDGSTLKTERGRAEVLLTPGSFLRLDENSSIRMVSGALVHTKIAFLRGAVIFDLTESAAPEAIEVEYQDSQLHFEKKGVYRIDGDTGVLQAYSGSAEVACDGKSSHVDASHLFFFTLNLETNKLDGGTEDEFYDWARDRNQEIADENQLTAETNADPGDADGSALGAIPSIPSLGIPNAGLPDPGIPSPSIPTYPSLGGIYPGASALMNPFLSFSNGPFVPYAGFPMIVLLRPATYRHNHHEWPNRTGTPVWRPVSAGGGVSHWPTHSPTLSYRPSATGIRTYRPLVGTGIGAYRPAGTGMGTYRPMVPRTGAVVARPVRPAISPPAVHPIGRR